MNHAIEIKEEIHDIEVVDNINSNIKFVDTKLVKSETFVDVSEIKTEKLDFLIEESNDKVEIKTDPLEVPTVHEGNKQFKCTICDYKFTRKFVLEKHIESVHEGIKPFKCAICDYKFTRKFVLKKHIESIE